MQTIPMKPARGIFVFSLVFWIGVTSHLAYGQDWPGVRDSLYSEILKEQRKIQIVLPPEYEDNPTAKFEVLYVLDGEWYMQQIPFIYNFVRSSGYAPPNIFVLIPNRYVDQKNLRDRDFSPTAIANDANLGGADNFHAFLKNELIPYIEKKYRTNGQRSLVGSSFSGLFAVYAFVKDPQLFQSYVASDPNLNWDNNHVSRLAAEVLPGFSHVTSTLFIGGLTHSFAGMGIAEFDSVLREKAPASIVWKCLPYENETHYSVQHKAFYDGFRFSHFGYSKTAPEFHPRKGILEQGKPLAIFFLTPVGQVRYTTDGSEPDNTSPQMPSNNILSLSGPCELQMKYPANRPQYARAEVAVFSPGAAMKPEKLRRSSKPGLRYHLYEGDWKQFPSTAKIKPAKSGVIDDHFNLNAHDSEKNTAWLIEGFVNIPEDGHYVFASQSEHFVSATIAKLPLINTDGKDSKSQSFVVPLKKGLFPLRIEFFRPKGSGEIHFMIGGATGSNDRWWTNPILRF